MSGKTIDPSTLEIYSIQNEVLLHSDKLKITLAEQKYYLDEITCRKIVNYLRVGKPIGLRGEPGVGKSELPERIATILHAKLVDIECHSQLEAMDIGVSWNGFKQMMDTQTGNIQEDPFSFKYLNRTPLITSLLSDTPVVVRVDEVDKLNENTSNFFLRFLDKKELVIHDLYSENNVLKARSPILIFLTSNEYRELDPAMMRRIAWVDLSFPNESLLSTIIHSKINVSLAIAKRISYLVIRLRDESLQKKPSIGEVLDWTRALVFENGGHITLDAIQVTLGLLLKYGEDERKGWEAIQTWLT